MKVGGAQEQVQVIYNSNDEIFSMDFCKSHLIYNKVAS